MELMTYNSYDSNQTKIDKAMSVLVKLEELRIVECPCRDYDSSKDLSDTLVRLDLDCVVSLIEVFSTFVRVHRSTDFGLRFGAIIHDLVQNPRLRQDVFSRP